MPTWNNIPVTSQITSTLETLAQMGALLGTQDAAGKPNVMAISWASIGNIWGLPIFQIFVRPSRYTTQLLQANPDFTINLLPPDRSDDIAYCGAVSGKSIDKLELLDLTISPAQTVKAPIIDQATLVYECRTLLTADVQPDHLDHSLIQGSYQNGDYHRIYFGHILALSQRA